MKVHDILDELATHMIHGMMVHEQLMNCYRFLSLPGYARLHEYRYKDETEGYIRFTEFVTNHFDTLVKPNKVEDPGIVPVAWYSIIRPEVSFDIRRESVSTGLSEWIDWEKDTLHLYEDACQELFKLGDMVAYNFVNKYVDDTFKELIYAKNEQLSKKSMNYDMTSIIEEQDTYDKFYKKKLRKLKGA